jgi:cyclase
VRKRLEKGQFMAMMQRMIEPAPPQALPTLTFNDEMHFYLDGQDVHVLHLPQAHTDGDAVIHFPGLNAFHMGDNYVARMYPFPDAGSGGSIDGIIAAADRLLPLMDERTLVIPGHGALSNKAEYAAFRAMAVAIRANVRGLIAKGMTREQVVAAKPTAAYDADYGGGFIKPDVFAGMLFDQLSAR